MGRTFLVWVIFLLIVIISLSQVGSVFFLYSGAFPLPQEVLAQLDKVSSVEIAVNLLVSVYYLAAGIALFMMRRIALPLFLIGIPIDILQYVLAVYTRGSEFVTETGSLLITLACFAIGLLICFYVWTLDRRDMLA